MTISGLSGIVVPSIETDVLGTRMNWVKLLVLLGCLSAISTVIADEADRSDAESQIHDVIGDLTQAWRAGNGKEWAESFAEDADFTVWFGLRMKGKEQIAWGHQLIFDSFYANTAFELDIDQIRFLGDDVVIVHMQGSVVLPGEESPAEPDAVPIAVMNRIDNAWKIVAFQNTPFVVNEFRMNGDLKRFKQLAAEMNAKQ